MKERCIFLKLFIGCSSRDEVPLGYYDYCKNFLDELFAYEHDLVFGACGKGLMGLSYNVAINNCSDVIGIYPEFYKSEADGLQCLGIPVKTVSERTDKVIEQSDALIFLPGGIGTLYELFTAIESKRACEHNKPIIIYNCCGFYDNVLMQLGKMKEEKFMSSEDERCYCVCSSMEQVIEYLNSYDNKSCMMRKKDKDK